MSTIADYTDRKFDIVAYAGALPSGSTLLSQTLCENGGEICTGIYKLVQRFLLELFTELGSQVYQPLRGCSFMTQVRRGELRTQLDVFAAFSSALVQIEQNLKLEESEDDPDEERFDSAEVLSVALVGDSVAITVAISSLAGVERSVILPITTVPGGPHAS